MDPQRMAEAEREDVLAYQDMMADDAPIARREWDDLSELEWKGFEEEIA